MKSKNPPDHMLPTMADTNQSRLTPMFLKDSDFDHIEDEPASEEEPNEVGLHGMEGINPFTRMGSNPATSEKQARFMRACEHNPGSMSKPCPSKAVAKEFNHTD